jgi:hypothetical protein
MIANRPLAIFVKSSRKPHRPAISQRTETGVDVIKARIDQFDGNNQAPEHVGDCAMRIDIGSEFVAAKQRVAGEERIALAFKI